ncbi:hypothetical protein CYMTET_10661 [Cymbomonas tetramitiformis]|uniref:Uncharacterized protein n=1 Tax=Cymbomonas tetramitiformis TaxID=36881 RepID=A0AAE0GNP8_9CHLO|nr:hypothetical protein CYMTET_10661 [Cymbomonas tetramitiformis]
MGGNREQDSARPEEEAGPSAPRANGSRDSEDDAASGTGDGDKCRDTGEFRGVNNFTVKFASISSSGVARGGAGLCAACPHNVRRPGRGCMPPLRLPGILDDESN